MKLKYKLVGQDFLNIDKSPNRNFYLFGIYFCLFVFLQIVNWVFMNLDTKFLHVEYMHLLVKAFPSSFFFNAWSNALFPADMAILFFHNFSANFMKIIAGVSMETSLFWANMLYTLCILLSVDFTASKIYDSYFFRISSVFVFLTMPGNISGMRLLTVHYGEMALICVIAAIYISFYAKPSLFKVVLFAVFLSFLPGLYRSGFVYGIYTFAFFIFFLFFIKKTIWQKLLYLLVFFMVLKLMVYQTAMTFFYQENSPTKEITFVQTLDLFAAEGVYKFLCYEWDLVEKFIFHFFGIITMKFYAYFYLMVTVLVCLFRSFRFFPKKNFSFYLYLLGVFFVPGSVIVLSGIGVDGVSYPLYLIFYWFLVISVHSFRSVSYKLYGACMALMFVVGCWMLLGSSMSDGYKQHLYYRSNMSTPIDNLIKYRPFAKHNNVLPTVRYYISSFFRKHNRRPSISFLQVRGNEITNMPGMFHYLNTMGEIKLNRKFEIENADFVVLSFTAGHMYYKIHHYGLINYEEDNLEGYMEFRSKEHLDVFRELAKPYIPKALKGYRLKAVIFSPYGLDTFNLKVKYHFWFEKII